MQFMDDGFLPREHRKIRIVLAASEPSRRRSLADDLESEGFVLCALEESANGAIAAAIAQQPDVFVLADDLRGSPLVAAARIAAAAPRTKVVVVVDTVDEEDCMAHLLAGASGYVSVNGDGAGLASAVRGVAEGLAIVPPAAQRRLLEELHA
jgi:DNA-binding NarL/FixJ family response regulator